MKSEKCGKTPSSRSNTALGVNVDAIRGETEDASTFRLQSHPNGSPLYLLRVAGNKSRIHQGDGEVQDHGDHDQQEEQRRRQQLPSLLTPTQICTRGRKKYNKHMCSILNRIHFIDVGGRG